MVKFTQNGKTQFLNRDKFRSLVVKLKSVTTRREIIEHLNRCGYTDISFELGRNGYYVQVQTPRGITCFEISRLKEEIERHKKERA